MRIRVQHAGVTDLARDLRQIPPSVSRKGAAIVKEGARTGGMLARDNARRSAGRHGKHYPRSITWDRAARSFYGFGGGSIQAEYGPDASKPQGGMSFEHGSRNQPPHLDLAKSADVIGPAFQGEVSRMVEGLFWD